MVLEHMASRALDLWRAGTYSKNHICVEYLSNTKGYMSNTPSDIS